MLDATCEEALECTPYANVLLVAGVTFYSRRASAVRLTALVSPSRACFDRF